MRTALLRSARRAVVTWLLVASALFAAGSHTASPAPRPVEVPRSSQAAALIAQHGCWRGGDAPADVIPGHAVVDTGDGPHYGSADEGFAIWLDGAPGTIHAFCP